MLFDTENFGDEINKDKLTPLNSSGYTKFTIKQNNLPISEKQGLVKLKRKQEINSIQYPNPLDEFPDLTENLSSRNLAEEQRKDADIRKVIGWVQQNIQQLDLKYASTNLKKYYKHL